MPIKHSKPLDFSGYSHLTELFPDLDTSRYMMLVDQWKCLLINFHQKKRNFFVDLKHKQKKKIKKPVYWLFTSDHVIDLLHSIFPKHSLNCFETFSSYWKFVLKVLKYFLTKLLSFLFKWDHTYTTKCNLQKLKRDPRKPNPHLPKSSKVHYSRQFSLSERKKEIASNMKCH